jgi:hypothetical protein
MSREDEDEKHLSEDERLAQAFDASPIAMDQTKDPDWRNRSGRLVADYLIRRLSEEEDQSEGRDLVLLLPVFGGEGFIGAALDASGITVLESVWGGSPRGPEWICSEDMDVILAFVRYMKKFTMKSP